MSELTFRFKGADTSEDIKVRSSDVKNMDSASQCLKECSERCK
jgi:hypothetical protein